MQNNEIKQMAKEKNIRLWQIADVYGITDGNFSRLLRKELPTDKKEKIVSIINKLSEEVQA